MATKPKANPMRKPKTPSTRAPITRGQDREATAKAQLPISMKATARQMEADKVSWAESIRRAGASRAAGTKARLLREESARIKKSGERMGRMQAAAKAKRGK